MCCDTAAMIAILFMIVFAWTKTDNLNINAVDVKNVRLKKINKCFSGHFVEKQMRQAGGLFVVFISQKTDEATFLLFNFIKT